MRTVLCAAAALLVAGCTAEHEIPRNFLLITIGTLRADRLGAYGHVAPTSPRIDALARESVVFLDARATSSWTLPSLASIMTGEYASTHGAWSFDTRLAESHVTLAEILRDAGFATGGVGSHTFLARKYGLQQGFQDYDIGLIHRNLTHSHEGVTSPRVTTTALDWIRDQASSGERWFYWAHYFDPHEKYVVHPGVSARFGTEAPADRYEGEIAYTDRSIGALLDGVYELGLSNDTLVALTSDHGEEFGEHGGAGHGRHLHGEVVHVPLIFRAPGLLPRRIEGAIALVDVRPTVLEMLGLPPDSSAGRSLVPALRGASIDAQPLLMEVRLEDHVEALELDGWKLVRTRASSGDIQRAAARAKAPNPVADPRRLALYDVRSDPQERRDLLQTERERVARMEPLLQQLVRGARESGRRHPAAPAPDLSPEERQALRDLGYVE